MNMPNLPGWFYTFIYGIFALIILLAILAISKTDVSIGAHGIHATSDLIHVN